MPVVVRRRTPAEIDRVNMGLANADMFVFVRSRLWRLTAAATVAASFALPASPAVAMPAYIDTGNHGEPVVVQGLRQAEPGDIGYDAAIAAQNPLSLDKLDALGGMDFATETLLSDRASIGDDPLANAASQRTFDTAPGTPNSIRLGPSDPASVRPEDIVRMLVNVRPSADTGSGFDGPAAAPAAAQGRGQGAGSLGSSIASEFSQEIVEAMTGILRPAIDTQGLVTFTIGGFGNFMIMTDRNTDEFQVVDVDRGTAVNFGSAPATTNISRPGDSLAPQGSENRNRGAAATTSAGSLKSWIVSSITNPFFVSAIVLLVTLWFVWRLIARNA